MSNEYTNTSKCQDEYDIPRHIQLIASYDSDSNSESDLEIEEGYDSDSPKLKSEDIEYDPPISDAVKESVQNDLAEYEIDFQNIEDVWDDQQETAHLEEEEACLAINDTADLYSDSDSDCESELKSKHKPIVSELTFADAIDLGKVWTPDQIESMRANLWFRLAQLIPASRYVGDDYTAIISAFKNESSFDDNQRMYMISEIIVSKFGIITDNDRYHLGMYISRKSYSRASKNILSIRWPRVMSIAKDANPNGYTNWDNARHAAVRQAKAARDAEAQKMTNSVYRFMRTMNPDAMGDRVIVSELHQRYVDSCDEHHEVLSSTAFGMLLSRFGIGSKQVWIDGTKRRAYDLSNGAVAAWLQAYQT